MDVVASMSDFSRDPAGVEPMRWRAPLSRDITVQILFRSRMMVLPPVIDRAEAELQLV